MSTKHAQLMKRYGLERIELPAHVGDVVEKRIAGLWAVNYHGCSLEQLPEAIRKYGFDCYSQGLLDATTPTVRARVQKLALEGVVPPMDCSAIDTEGVK